MVLISCERFSFPLRRANHFNRISVQRRCRACVCVCAVFWVTSMYSEFVFTSACMREIVLSTNGCPYTVSVSLSLSLSVHCEWAFHAMNQIPKWMNGRNENRFLTSNFRLKSLECKTVRSNSIKYSDSFHMYRHAERCTILQTHRNWLESIFHLFFTYDGKNPAHGQIG